MDIMDDLKDSTVGIKTVETESGLHLIPERQSVEIVSSSDRLVTIYNIKGQIVRTVNVRAGQKNSIHLSSGVYLIDKRRVLIK